MTEDRFDLGRFKRAVSSRRDVVREDADSITFEIPYSQFEAWYEQVQPIFIPREDDLSGASARRKLIREAERYGEEMHEGRT